MNIFKNILRSVAAMIVALCEPLYIALTRWMGEQGFIAYATLAVTHPTLLDVAKRMDPNGNIDMIAEMLAQMNPVLDDMVFLEGNLPTGHRSTIRTGLPIPTWRKLYGGVQPTKSTTAQVTDSCGMLEAYAEIDKALAELNGNQAAWRLSEDRAHIEGMSQELAQTLFYGNETTEPEAFTGFGPRFNDQAAENGGNILTSAATPDATDNTSIWLVVWSPNTAHGIYPKGSKAGLTIEDKGQVTAESIDGSNGRAEIYRTHYRWDCGLTVRDWRYVVRVQVDQEDLTKAAATGPDLVDLLQQATVLIPNLGAGRPAFYCNRTVLSFLKRQMTNKMVNSTLTMEQLNGKWTPMFEGIPIRRCDAITNTEAGI